MRTPLVVAGVAAALGAASLFVVYEPEGVGDGPTGPVEVSAPAARASRDLSASTTASGGARAARARPRGQGAVESSSVAGKAYGPRNELPKEVQALAYAPTASLAQSFAWSLQDPRTRFLARWHREMKSGVRERCDAINRTAHRAQRPMRVAFNERVCSWRAELVTQLGELYAARVLEKYPLYLFDLEKPRAGWYRIDVRGERVPFRHDDEQRWDGYELRDA